MKASFSATKAAARSLRWSILAVIGVAALTACYTPNQPAFEAAVQKRVKTGMPLTTAVANLGDLKLTCTGTGPVVCDRIRQRLLPSSCIERVRLTVSQPNREVDAIAVDPIICAGL